MKLLDVTLFELRQRFKKVSTYVYFVFFLLLGYFAVFTALLGGGPLKNYLNAGVGSIHANAPFVIHYLITMMSHIGIFITAAYFGHAAYRDFRDNTFEMYFSYPLKKIEFLAGRFLAGFVCTLFVFTGTGIGAFLANLFPFVNAEKLGPIHVLSYVQPYLFGVIPNLLFTGALFFSIALLSRKIFSVYLGSIGLFMGYLIGLSLIQSQSRFLASLIDPFGQLSIRSLYDYWAIAQKNSQLIPFAGPFLLNRIIWLSAACLLMIWTYKKFQFSYLHKSRKQKRLRPKGFKTRQESENIKFSFDSTTTTKTFKFWDSIKQIRSIALQDFKSLVKNIYFLVFLFLGILFMLVIGFRNVGLIRGTQTYPTTYQVIDSLGNLFMFFLFILIAFCAGELVWKERRKKAHEIFDTLPVKTWVPVLGKLGALVLIQCVLMLVLLCTGILVQALHGYFRFELGLYIQELFGMRLITFILMAILALFLQIAVNNKLFGYFLFALFLILQDAIHMIGLEHHLWGFADILTSTYSEMSGYGPYANRLFFFNLYYSGVAFLLIILSLVLWIRGLDTKVKDRLSAAKKRMTVSKKWAFGAGLLFCIFVGSFILYNTHILNAYESQRRTSSFRANYEKKFKPYESVPLPSITDIKMNVDIYPKQKKVASKGTMRLKNKKESPVKDIFVQMSREVKVNRLQLKTRASVQEVHKEFGVTIFKLEQPLLPGDVLTLDFDFEASVKGFQNHASGGFGVFPSLRTGLLKNGTFIYPWDTTPSLCYDPFFSMELSDNKLRQKYGLKQKPILPAQTDEEMKMYTPMGRDADWINFEATVSTSADQVALTAGKLQDFWEEGNRRYFSYKAEQKILKYFPFLSARYEVKKDLWKDVDIEVYYHPGHDYNIDMMIRSIKMSLDYYTANFSPYQFREIRIVEFPKYRIMAEGFPTIIPFSEGYGFIAKFDGTKVAYVFRATAHEVAHQWWGHQVMGAQVEGVYFLMESLAQYSAIMVTKKEYDQILLNDYMLTKIDAYLRGRARETRKEVPMLYSNRAVPYVNYDKGIVVMNALQAYIGEKNLNAAIGKYIQAVAFQNPPFTTSSEFFKYLKAATPEHLKYILKDWFETITLSDNRAINATGKKLDNGLYQVKFQFEAAKYKADDLGAEEAVAMDDFIFFGVFGAEGEVLYSKKHKIQSGVQELVLFVDGEPARVGIDPFYYLIDKDPKDNVVSIDTDN